MIVFRRHLALAHLGATRSARKRNEISISSSSLMLCCISTFSLRELLKFRWAGGGRLGPARGSRHDREIFSIRGYLRAARTPFISWSNDFLRSLNALAFAGSGRSKSILATRK